MDMLSLFITPCTKPTRIQCTINPAVREAISAIQIEKTHTKKEILQMYLNVNYWGRGAYGLQVASQLYFGKDPKQLTVAEAAYLVGILKGPENYDPDENYDRAIDRRDRSRR